MILKIIKLKKLQKKYQSQILNKLMFIFKKLQVKNEKEDVKKKKNTKKESIKNSV